MWATQLAPVQRGPKSQKKVFLPLGYPNPTPPPSPLFHLLGPWNLVTQLAPLLRGESSATGLDSRTPHSLEPPQWNKIQGPSITPSTFLVSQSRVFLMLGYPPTHPTPKPTFSPERSLEPCNKACSNTEGT